MMNGVVFSPGYGYSKAVTASDTADNCKNCVGLHNASDTGGTVKVTYLDGQTDSIYMAGGLFLSARVRRVWSTGTDAAIVGSIHALYG